MKLLNNINLKDKTTFKIGGIAKNFVILESTEDLERFLKIFKNFDNFYFVLGGGSNVLIADKDFKGLIIQPSLKFIQQIEDNIIEVGSGVDMFDLVKFTNDYGYKGLENAYGLPGSLGGAIRGNAGCFGFEIKDLVIEVTAFNLKTGELKTFNKIECDFSYRTSFFKKAKDWLILSTKLFFAHRDKKENLWKISLERLNYRKNKQPLEYPNAGSVFKNIPFETAPKLIQDLALEKNKIKTDPFPIIPAAFLIAEAGLTGKQTGQAKISEKHPNFIINLGGASFNDVISLIDYIQKTIEDKFNIKLEPEIEIVNF